MSNITFDIGGIIPMLQNLTPGKAAGPDDMPSWILKACAERVAQVLQVIFTQ